MSKRVLKKDLEAKIAVLEAEIRDHWFARKALGDKKATMPCFGYDMKDRTDTMCASYFAHGFMAPGVGDEGHAAAFSRFKELSEF